MRTRLTIDGAGRVLLPKPLRKALHLGPGNKLELESTGEEITLRPVRSTTLLAKEKGVWVFRTGQPIDASVVDDIIQDSRLRHSRVADPLDKAPGPE